MSTSRRQQREAKNRAEAWRGAAPVRKPPKEEPRVVIPLSNGLKYSLGIAAIALGTGVAYHPINEAIVDALTSDEPCYVIGDSRCVPASITDQSSGQPGVQPNRAPMLEGESSVRWKVGRELGFNVCKDYIFVNNETGQKIYSPIVDFPKGNQEDGVFPRPISPSVDGQSLTVAPADKPTDYQWILPNRARLEANAGVDYCAAQMVLASEDNTSDSIRLRIAGSEPFDEQSQVAVNLPG